MSPHPDQLVEYLARARAGDETAREALLTLLYVPVRRALARRLQGDPDAGEIVADLTHEVLIKILEHLSECTAQTEAQLLGWVLTIARHTLIDHWRGLRAERTILFVLRDSGPEHEAELYRVWMTAEHGMAHPAEDLLVAMILSAYRSLPERTQELIWLRRVAGGAWAEVGDELDLSVTAVKRQYQRAQGRLRRLVLAAIDRLLPSEQQAVRDRLGL